MTINYISTITMQCGFIILGCDFSEIILNYLQVTEITLLYTKCGEWKPLKKRGVFRKALRIGLRN